MSTFQMRRACANCESPFGRLEKRGNQNCVFCVVCGTFVYNAPKTETGERPRSVTTVHRNIRPRVRAKVLLRANSRCELCGAGGNERQLHVSHLVSVDDGMAAGLSDLEINHEENLAAFCEECNLGLGGLSVTVLALMSVALRRRVKRATA